ncbi:phosphatidate cytidylyltransferase [Maritimibacter sp. UBA3975]|uniref:phosphatidate cytidylyltransferase n=1 Tax=Maritimibacter sp. UBA3975 TaxID=1946833 RepID=UPI000C096EA6|nr:phosphatidate cytidylyltransferase [Maritimibacter sp. UBA3975]MAM61976.1 phosphatidate cytidylyltransferase [Maritimibacter sp.]|tara:strand:+ start:2586 stop:3527 length:942 start_codon:yes stop_codon:yes gene_type:complete
MSASAEFYGLLLAIVLVLSLASILGETLRRRFDADGTNTLVENLNARISSWWAMVVLLALSFLFGSIGVIVLFALLSFAALREFLTLTAKSRADHYALLVSFFVIVPVQYWLIYIDWYGLYSIFIPVYAFLFMPILVALRGDTTRFLSRVAETQWGLMVAVFAASHVPALLTLDIPGFDGREILLIAWLVVVVQGADVLQYVWSKLWGRHPVAPTLSPSKTWEGFAGGIVSAAILGAVLSWLTPFAVWQSAGVAVTVTLMGLFGGLVMSAIKRDKGVKDWGHLIAGHGGFTDRLDSVVFAAPIFFHIVRYFWS